MIACPNLPYAFTWPCFSPFSSEELGSGSGCGGAGRMRPKTNVQAVSERLSGQPFSNKQAESVLFAICCDALPHCLKSLGGRNFCSFYKLAELERILVHTKRPCPALLLRLQDIRSPQHAPKSLPPTLKVVSRERRYPGMAVVIPSPLPRRSANRSTSA